MLTLDFGLPPLAWTGRDGRDIVFACDDAVDDIDGLGGRLIAGILSSAGAFFSIDNFSSSALGWTVSTFAADAAVGAVRDAREERGLVGDFGFETLADFGSGLDAPLTSGSATPFFGCKGLTSVFFNSVFGEGFGLSTLADLGDGVERTALAGVTGVFGLLERIGDLLRTFGFASDMVCDGSGRDDVVVTRGVVLERGNFSDSMAFFIRVTIDPGGMSDCVVVSL
jgi:hypothetical protein